MFAAFHVLFGKLRAKLTERQFGDRSQHPSHMGPFINRTPADPCQGYHAGWKRSGLGGDDGKHGMLQFTQTRLVIVSY